ncbi:hypothetical protein DMH88_12035 [Escherichia coli]|nr:hypothetical protein [Escherichia coli]
MNAVVPQNSSGVPAPSSRWMRRRYRPSPPGATCSTSESAGCYLNEQPQGWLSAHRLMKPCAGTRSHELPPDVDKTRLARRAPNHATSLSGWHAQQNWTELLEQADLMFSTGAPAISGWRISSGICIRRWRRRAPWDRWTAVIRQDLALLLERLAGAKIWHGTTARVCR